MPDGTPPSPPLATAAALLRPDDGYVVDLAPGDAMRLRRLGLFTATFAVHEHHGVLHGTPADGPRRERPRGRRQRRYLTLVSHRAPVPAVVGAAAPGTVLVRFGIGNDPRRRTSLLVAAAPGEAPTRLVKASPRASDGARGPAEQQHLRRIEALGLGRHVPRALGYGTEGDLEWSVESAAPGVASAASRRGWRLVHGRAVLDALARWLGDLAVATMHRSPRGEASGHALAIHPDLPARVGDIAYRLGDPARTMTHGDLAAGENTLVTGRRFTIIDWETATDDGVPLVDLLPTLALGMARQRGWREPGDQATYALRLARGDAHESRWFHAHVAAYLDRIGMSHDRAGSLASFAWGRLASLHRRHDELVGRRDSVVSAADRVLDGWLADEALGERWPAFAGRATPALR